MSNLSDAQKIAEVVKLHVQLTSDGLSQGERAGIIGCIDDIDIARGLIRELVKDISNQK